MMERWLETAPIRSFAVCAQERVQSSASAARYLRAHSDGCAACSAAAVSIRALISSKLRTKRRADEELVMDVKGAKA